MNFFAVRWVKTINAHPCLKRALADGRLTVKVSAFLSDHRDGGVGIAYRALTVAASRYAQK